MLLTSLIVTFLVVQMVRVTLAGKDAWPFSHYPMFSHRTDLSKVEVFRVALETTVGEVIWWRSRFYRSPEHIGKVLKRIQAQETDDAELPLLPVWERHQYLSEVVRLIRLEEGDAHRYRALQIVRRTVREDHGRVVIDDQTVATVPIEDIGSAG